MSRDTWQYLQLSVGYCCSDLWLFIFNLFISTRTIPQDLCPRRQITPRSPDKTSHRALLLPREPLDTAVVRNIALLVAGGRHLRCSTSSRALKAQWLSDPVQLKVLWGSASQPASAPVLVLALALGWSCDVPGADSAEKKHRGYFLWKHNTAAPSPQCLLYQPGLDPLWWKVCLVRSAHLSVYAAWRRWALGGHCLCWRKTLRVHNSP